MTSAPTLVSVFTRSLQASDERPFEEALRFANGGTLRFGESCSYILRDAEDCYLRPVQAYIRRKSTQPTLVYRWACGSAQDTGFAGVRDHSDASEAPVRLTKLPIEIDRYQNIRP